MSAPRASSLRTLSKFSKQVRQLHITGPATFPSPLLTGERPAAAAVARARDTIAKRPTIEAEEGSSVPSRHFNTSRELKAVNDSSTIDFAYLPSFDPDSDVTAANVQVPIIGAWGRSNYVEPAEAEVMRPEISTATIETGHISTMAEVHDNNAAHIDFHGIAERVLNTAAPKGESNGEPGIIGTIWKGLVEDLASKPASKTQ